MDVMERLVELLSENISEFCKLSVIRGTTKITAITLDADRFVDHLIAHGVTVHEWISVKDRLPECDQVVLCYKADRGVRAGKHLAATYADGVSAFKDCCRDYAFGATHWMPLPQPPKGE